MWGGGGASAQALARSPCFPSLPCLGPTLCPVGQRGAVVGRRGRKTGSWNDMGDLAFKGGAGARLNVAKVGRPAILPVSREGR